MYKCIYIHVAGERIIALSAAIIHRVCLFAFFFFYNFIHRRYHQLSLSLSSLVNNKGTFFLILVIISVILTLLIDTKRYLKIYSLNIILVKSLYARDEC